MSAPEQPLIFAYSADDPLSPEHVLIGEWVREASAARPAGRYYETVELKKLPSGRAVLASSPERSRLLVLAAVQQAQFWRETEKKLGERGAREGMGGNPPAFCQYQRHS